VAGGAKNNQYTDRYSFVTGENVKQREPAHTKRDERRKRKGTQKPKWKTNTRNENHGVG